MLHVGLGDIKLTDAGLHYLKEFDKLELLDVQNSRITVGGLGQLTGLPNLKWLWLSGTDVSASEAQKMQVANPKLKVQR